MKTIKNTSYTTNLSPDLLFKDVNTMPLLNNNTLILFVEKVSVMQLTTIEFDRLFIAALQYLLSCFAARIALYRKTSYFWVTKGFSTPCVQVSAYNFK